MNYTSTIDNQNLVSQVANNLANNAMNSDEALNFLTQQGLKKKEANDIIDRINDEIFSFRKKDANKDILWGAIWCFGGVLLTYANIGFIFWGAIIFGGIQLVKGIINSSKL